MKSSMTTKPGGTLEAGLPRPMHRRNFLRYAGVSVLGTGLLAAACTKDDPNPLTYGETVNLGSGDIGILNYAYALEQLEAAFYIQVIQTQYSGITAAETALLTDIRDHEVAHREFFKAALGISAIGGLTPDFSKINFSSRESVLATAKTFEDLGVSAYNGAGRYLTSADYLTIAGKIVSVEARHAAYIRNLISNGSFANSEVVDANGLDVVRTPTEVIILAQPFVRNTIDATNLPIA
ncbi:MAG: ferritin-like domain-containing protein [Cytophagaceae bacterium]|nr:ferritin-like domain-containing protein [Cytophagaceae bacterium]